METKPPVNASKKAQRLDQVVAAEPESQVRLRAILENAVDGIITINDQGTIESLNPAAQALFGDTVDELIGGNVKLLMPEPYRAEHDQYLRNYQESGMPKVIGIGCEVVGRRKDGSVFPLDLSVSEFKIGDRRLFTGIVRDVTKRKQSESHRNLLMAELSHRVKNPLATVISIAQKSFQDVDSLDEARASFEGRVRALAQTHSRLAETNWAGADLREVIADEVSPYGHAQSDDISLTGPAVRLTPRSAIILGMAFHELATNAAKHGALSVADGRVDVSWDVDGPGGELMIRWIESGGPAVATPQRKGFGRFLLERGLAIEVHGKVQLDFDPGGLRCVIVLPSEKKLAELVSTSEIA